VVTSGATPTVAAQSCNHPGQQQQQQQQQHRVARKNDLQESGVETLWRRSKTVSELLLKKKNLQCQSLRQDFLA
jgi:hypothetical protein